MGFSLRTRHDLENIERTTLAPYAAFSGDHGASRLQREPEHPYRTAFQRDRDRIIHSRAFRRLKHKRQVFLTESGDHYRTRLTHTLEVAQLSRTMARSMGVNEDLVEAIALGHDLGHTPFGHVGEVVLHEIMSGRDTLSGVLPGHHAGGYKHNYQSLRVVDVLEKKYQWDGLNLTAAVREGILKHTRLRREALQFPNFESRGLHYELDNAVTLEGQIVAVCDEIAQRTHDLEDGIRANFVTLEQVRQLPIIHELDQHVGMQIADDFIYRNALIRALINFLVTDVMEASLARIERFMELMQRSGHFDTQIIWFSDRVNPLQEELDRFIMNEIIKTASEERGDDSARRIIRSLFKMYFLYPKLLPDYRLKAAADEKTRQEISSSSGQSASAVRDLQQNPQFLRTICDHIAGMTDNYAEAQYDRLKREHHGS